MGQADIVTGLIWDDIVCISHLVDLIWCYQPWYFAMSLSLL